LNEEGLNREIRRWDLVALLVNVTVGAGIFKLPADVQKAVGNYSLAAFVVCAGVIVLIALCFAEVASRFTSTGGPYLYAKETFGSSVGFLVGWLMWLTRLAGFATLLLVIVSYLGYFWPPAESGMPRIAVIVGLVLVLTVINLIGVKQSTRTSDVFTVGKLIPLLVFVGVGLFFISLSSFTFDSAPNFGPFSGAVFILIYAFSGFEAVLINTGEIRQPQRIIPFALIVALGASVVLFLLIQIVCIGTLPLLANSERPLADASAAFLGAWGPTMIAVGALISVFGTLNVIMLASSRMPFAMALHGQLPSPLARVHSRFRTPHVSIVVSALAILVFALPGTFIYAVKFTVITRLLVFVSTCVALPILRSREKTAARSPEVEPPSFKVPAGPFIAAVCVALCLWLLANSGWVEIRDVSIATAIGMIVYAATQLSQRKG
jgi:APA family basic amino acid/polyamine antiporter